MKILDGRRELGRLRKRTSKKKASVGEVFHKKRNDVDQPTAKEEKKKKGAVSG